MNPQRGNNNGQAQLEEPPLFFYMPNGPHGELCQWHPCQFTITKAEINALIGHPDDAETTEGDKSESITFSCAEQFMMYCKAGRFHDTKTQTKVMATDDPNIQKRLGKGVIGFSDSSWDMVKSEVVIAGNMAKFGQNPKLKRKLMATGNRLLVEAASRDRVWGIGYSEKHAMSHRQHWGENRLGKALMIVRERLRGSTVADGQEPGDQTLE